MISNKFKESFLVICLILIIFIGGFAFSEALEMFSQNKVTIADSIIKESQVEVYEDKVIIYVNSTLKTLYQGGSMLPALSGKMQGILAKVNDPSELEEGDIISYYDIFGDSVGHRIVKIDYDKKGWYAYAKGDTNPWRDPGKIRFDKVIGLLIGVIY